ncbi:MAG: sulfate adenylyltransferase subunit CysD [Rhodospirillaceae bacterium]|nr:sulfate adenylyltransferase subunit CysD [Rhodospirillaceae bacterium]|tara:strand:- start:6910 stop:7806 length:897 start_codon:yes stop_codon:yes gene_type:complete
MPNHLEQLESESIFILREIVAQFRKPVMLYSVGKDSSVMLHLAEKAFFPAPIPFPVLHVDTTWKFKEMISFRDRVALDKKLELIAYTNEEGIKKGINPFSSGSAVYIEVMKTEALKKALDHYGFDAAIGGARRDEEKSRAKERIFSIRNSSHRWDPKRQRPELWKIFNGKIKKDESIRAFPLSNWTEFDVWHYIYEEKIDIPSLYFAKPRPVVRRENTLIVVDDERLPLERNESPILRPVRFRSLGCYPLTGAVESEASTVLEILEEMMLSKSSERVGRLIDNDAGASMEEKKQEGYF